MIILPYAIIVSLIAYCLNYQLIVGDKKQIKIKKTLAIISFIVLLFFVCNIAVLIEYQLNSRALIRFATENIIKVKNHYILGKGLFITIFLSVVTFAYNYFAAKARAKKLAQEAAKVNYEIDNEPEETPFWKKHHLPEVLCYIVLSTITYMIASSLFLNFIAFVAKNYIRYNM